MPERAKTCVVVTDSRYINADVGWKYTRCGQAVTGERDGWPMCEAHMDLFDPAKWDN